MRAVGGGYCMREVLLVVLLDVLHMVTGKETDRRGQLPPGRAHLLLYHMLRTLVMTHLKACCVSSSSAPFKTSDMSITTAGAFLTMHAHDEQQLDAA